MKPLICNFSQNLNVGGPAISNFKFQIRNLPWFFLCVLCVLCGETAVQAAALDRSAFTFTAYDLRAQVVPAGQGFDVTGRVTLRNDSSAPQRFIALQISSTLGWKSIALAGKPAAFSSGPYTTDIDHTGSVSEAVVTLSQAIPPKGAIELEVSYAGTIPSDATRLTRIGAPPVAAAQSDWDQISEAFTGVRGVGYVCWYPVALEAASLSNGSELSAVIGAWRERHAASTFHLTLVLASDNLIATNGRLLDQKATNTADGPVHARQYDFSPIGLAPPTFTIADYTLLNRPAINVLHLSGHQAGAQEYQLAAEKLLPAISDWFGAPRERVVVVELPEGYAPFNSGAMLFTPLVDSGRQAVEVAVAHPLARACLDAQRPWIAEGLAHFAQALVRERQDGRKAALAYLQQFRPALADAEQQARATPAGSSIPAEGEPLDRATDEIYYRGKAMFVWWMLRDMVGDAALQRAFHQYHAADDKEPAYVQRLVEAASQRKLEWFFDDWVYRDRGLPDFRVDSVFPRQTLPEPGPVIVTVTVQNDGDAGAEVPIIIPVEKGEAMERVQVAAHSKNSTRLSIPAIPTEATVNDGSVPESDVSNNSFTLKK